MLRFSITCCSVFLLAATLKAGDSTAPLPLTTTVEREPINTVVPIYRAYVTAEETKFCFLLPENYRLGGDPAHGRLELEKIEGDGRGTLAILGSGVAVDRDSQRELLAKRFPGGKISAEFPATAVGRAGLGFDVEWQSTGGLREKTRAIFVTMPSGVLELTMTAGLKNFRAAESTFNEWLGSITTATNGKLVIHRLDGKI